MKNPQIQTTIQDIYRKNKIDIVIEDVPDLIKESTEGVERVSTIVKNLKTFSRVDQQQRSPCNLNESLDSALNIVWNELKYKVTVEKDYQQDLPPLHCFPQQISQVFLNLLVNAGHAIEDQGIIQLRSWQQGDCLCVSISDSGCGMTEETQEKLFEPFFTTKEVGKGTGLGMSIVYEIVHKHGGKIDVASTLGEGSIFTLYWPLEEPTS